MYITPPGSLITETELKNPDSFINIEFNENNKKHIEILKKWGIEL